MFRLLQGNPISSIVTLCLIYVGLFIVGLKTTSENKLLTKVLLVCFFLVSIHPQYIIQGRFVWNPSLVTPFVIAALTSFYLLISKFSQNRLVVFSLSIATAISLSYSIAPLLVAFFASWLIISRKHFLKYCLYLGASFFIINSPTIMFEFRHRFQLIKAIFFQKSPVQQGLDFITRTNNLSQFIFSTSHHSLNILLFITSILVCSYFIFRNRHQKTSLQFISSFLYLSLLVISYLTPVSIQPHYVFAFTSLLFVIAATLPKIPLSLTLVFFSLVYLNPQLLKDYFKDAPRTYQQMTTCFEQYCSKFKDSTFVSVQSNFHPFHNGPEHRYLMSKFGCNVKAIETENGQAQFMTVILDSGTFDDRTNYYELELFGKYKQISETTCLPNFKILTLKKF